MSLLNKVLVIIFIFLLPTIIHSVEESWRTCDVNNSCMMIGEYVYNENYTAHTNQICTVNITYPNGTLAIIDANLENNSDGWHNYSYTPPIAGFYPTEMYCINGTDEGRIDKSFVAKIVSTSDISTSLTEVKTEMSAIAIAILAAGFLYLSSRFETREQTMLRVGSIAMGILLAANSALIAVETTATAFPAFKLLIWGVRIMVMVLFMVGLFGAIKVLAEWPKESRKKSKLY